MNKVALVTGNYQGLGKAISEILPSLGYEQPDVIRSADYDLTKQDQAEALVADTIAKYGRLDLLVNNVGNYVNANISDYAVEDWHEMFNSNLNSAFYLTRKALPYLREGEDEIKGRILNIGFAGTEHLFTCANTTAYQAAKSALLTLTRGLAQAEAPNGVLVNMMSPGHMENTVEPIDTSKVPLGRFASLDEACHAVKFFVETTYATGQNLELSGGWNL